MSINWSNLNESLNLLKQSDLMSGEERQLTLDEVEYFNEYFENILLNTILLKSLAEIAKNRFREIVAKL